MIKLLASVKKELTLLSRDMAGLLVLFVMPVVLVVVVTLVQENVLRSMGEVKTRVLFVDLDGQSVGRRIEESIRNSGSVQMVTEIKGKKVDRETARKAVAAGDFQLCVIIPEGISEAFRKSARQKVTDSLSMGDRKGGNPVATPEVPGLVIYFDPALREAFRLAAVASLQRLIQGMEATEKMAVLSELLPKKMEMTAKKAMGAMWSEEFKKAIPEVHIDWDNRPIIPVEEETAHYGVMAKTPTTVQQNVPAWTLFGMFFVVVPLGASLIRERQDGMLARLRTMPVSYLTVISGKITAYVIICMVQFGIIMAVGKTVLPLLGAPALDIGSSAAALILVALSAALAASGYGILLGAVARTYEQASTFGAVSVVIAAALGGIMVPVYVMPKIMQSIGLFSPLAWGLNAFLTVFVRGGGIWAILPEVALMLAFFASTTLLAWFSIVKRGRFRIR